MGIEQTRAKLARAFRGAKQERNTMLMRAVQQYGGNSEWPEQLREMFRDQDGEIERRRVELNEMRLKDERMIVKRVLRLIEDEVGFVPMEIWDEDGAMTESGEADWVSVKKFSSAVTKDCSWREAAVRSIFEVDEAVVLCSNGNGDYLKLIFVRGNAPSEVFADYLHMPKEWEGRVAREAREEVEDKIEAIMDDLHERYYARVDAHYES